MSPKPPDILRKSHRHAERKERATAKERLRRDASAAIADRDAGNVYVGRCACGALGYRYSTRVPPPRWAAWTCECRSCDPRAIFTADPGGALTMLVAEPDALERGRCELGAAELWRCGSCGDLVAAVTRGARACVNLQLLEDPPPRLPAAEPLEPDAEDRELRTARWQAEWTPLERSQ